ncbi:MAG: 16S rRNA (guanine(527)-N(7))-methyltransferase RsmG [Saprospiraceae bacterium]|jgi:16S rRNA (guanine527-N7)-methyltransferase|nr:16S rRNA (guanine(527)-N(7))-methyltransferase RsmG [Saprospiraceae bacterium]
MQSVKRYFPQLTDHQMKQFEALIPFYEDWNQKINVISRKDIEHLEMHHVLHSLAIVKMVSSFKPGTTVLDLGTGGGFPGIPLAIFFPKVEFLLIDGTGKKIKVVQAAIDELGLKNVTAMQKRAEELKQSFDFVVTRAVADLDKLWEWSQKLIHQNHKNGLPNGLITLKGGKIDQEIKALPKGTSIEKTAIQSWFDDPYFEEKYVVYVQR